MVVEILSYETKELRQVLSDWVLNNFNLAREYVRNAHPNEPRVLLVLECMFQNKSIQEIATHIHYSKAIASLLVQNVVQILNSDAFLKIVLPPFVLDNFDIETIRSLSLYTYYPFNCLDFSGQYTYRILEHSTFEIEPKDQPALQLPDFLRSVYFASKLTTSKKEIAERYLKVSRFRVSSAVSALQQLFPNKILYPRLHAVGVVPVDQEYKLQTFSRSSRNIILQKVKDRRFQAALLNSNFHEAFNLYDGLYKSAFEQYIRRNGAKAIEEVLCYLMLNNGLSYLDICDPINGFCGKVTLDNNISSLKKYLREHFKNKQFQNKISDTFGKTSEIFRPHTPLTHWLEIHIQKLSTRASILLSLLQEIGPCSVSELVRIIQNGSISMKKDSFEVRVGEILYREHTGKLVTWKVTTHNAFLKPWKEIIWNFGWNVNTAIADFHTLIKQHDAMYIES